LEISSSPDSRDFEQICQTNDKFDTHGRGFKPINKWSGFQFFFESIILFEGLFEEHVCGTPPHASEKHREIGLRNRHRTGRTGEENEPKFHRGEPSPFQEY
jgi:hypothetical protein